jgi:hypothetical protein
MQVEREGGFADYKHLAAGRDVVFDQGRGGGEAALTLVPEGEDFARAIRNGRTMAFGRCSMPLFHVFTTALLMERRVVKPKKSR